MRQQLIRVYGHPVRITTWEDVVQTPDVTRQTVHRLKATYRGGEIEGASERSEWDITKEVVPILEVRLAER